MQRRFAAQDITPIIKLKNTIVIQSADLSWYDKNTMQENLYKLHMAIMTITGATLYFADAHHSSQGARNENLNGLVRDFIPKGTDFKKLTPTYILEIEAILNTRPRVRLEGLTPLEAYMSEPGSVALVR